MIIRSAKAGDKEKISNLISLYRVELKQLKGITSTPDILSAKKEFCEYMDAKYPIFVAQDSDNRLCGYIVCRIDGDVVWAESLYVAIDSRRKGIATMLYKEVEKTAYDLGGDTVIIGFIRIMMGL